MIDIYEKAKQNPSNVTIWEYAFEYARSGRDDSMVRKVRVHSNTQSKKDLNPKWIELYWKCCLFLAPNSFDDFLLYIEHARPPKEQFYLPRRKILKQIVDSLQKLENDNLDELFLSMPPRVGKTSILMFFITWIIGRDSERTNLYSAYSDSITNPFYSGILEILTDPTYLWADVFPGRKISDTNAKNESLSLDRRKRYASVTCRSLYGTLNGSCDCNGYLIADDLISGIEEAMSKDRLLAAWAKVDNNLIPRAKENAKILWCGTRWSILDPIGIRMDTIENDPNYSERRIEVIDLPALDENGESNFDYLYGTGFSSEYYRQRMASFEKNNDMASWSAQYMCEPIEREGTMFSPQDMMSYNGILPGEPDRVCMVVDPAWGGSDFVAAPVLYQYDSDVYIPDVVYSDKEKRITQTLIADMVMEHNVTAMLVEASKTTSEYAEGIENILSDRGYKLSIQTKPASPNQSKIDRIFNYSSEIREFRYNNKKSKPYINFMQNVYSFKANGKNKHDDAPDSLAMAAEFIRNGQKQSKVSVFDRRF